MRKKIITMSLSLLFFGSIATTSLATTLQVNHQKVVVDGDKDKDKKKAKTNKSKTKECKSEKSCCKSELYEKSCKSDSKKGGDKK
jgi:hypothetical protein